MASERTTPAIFMVKGPDGHPWKARVTPLGIEAIAHDAENYDGYDGVVHFGGIARAFVPWSEILPELPEGRHALSV